MMKFYPVILSGGSGTRLWPLSRAAMPKQLLALTSQLSMLQSTVLRASSVEGAQAPLLIGNEAHRFLIQEQLNKIDVAPSGVILEPSGRNTAPAIALAALKLFASDPDAIMLILPADHILDDQEKFSQCVVSAVKAAAKGHLITFGIVPSYPETGYGYIRMGNSLDLNNVQSLYSVQSFIEKPNANMAQKFLEEGGFLWNSGMFVFSARCYLDELKRYRPDILNAAINAWDHRNDDLGFIRPEKDAFLSCPSESIDYAVMQKTTKAGVIPASFGWNDVGSWSSLWEISDKNERGNFVKGDVFIDDVSNSYIRASHRHVAVIGLSDLVVVETADAILVMHRNKSQEVKKAISFFEKEGRGEHLEHIQVYRPWGWYEGIDKGERFQVKRIMVRPGQKLSLQMHHHRAEHWIVVSGTAKVTVGVREILLTENQSTYIPLGEVHRLENPGKVDLHIVEVQSGSYLGEDDIVRISDNYGRTN